jgi:hypothetical protein
VENSELKPELNFNRIRDSGFGIRDSGFGIRDSGFGIRDSGFGIRDSGFGIRDSCYFVISGFDLHCASLFSGSSLSLLCFLRVALLIEVFPANH